MARHLHLAQVLGALGGWVRSSGAAVFALGGACAGQRDEFGQVAVAFAGLRQQGRPAGGVGAARN